MGSDLYKDDRFKMTFSVPSGAIVHTITMQWTDDDGTEYITNYWAELGPNEMTVEGLSVLEVDVRLYIGNKIIDEQPDHQEESVGSMNQVIEVANVEPSKERKSIGGDPDDDLWQRGCGKDHLQPTMKI